MFLQRLKHVVKTVSLFFILIVLLFSTVIGVVLLLQPFLHPIFIMSISLVIVLTIGVLFNEYVFKYFDI